MSYTVAFSTTQSLGEPSEIIVTDSSSGSDVTVSTRRVYLVTAQGQWLTENGLSDTEAYTLWPLADGATLTLDVLTEDMALWVTLAYVTSGGAVANGATLTKLQGYTLYDEDFYYGLTQDQALQNQPPPMVIQDANYYMNKMIFRVELDSGNQAIVYGNDIVSAQNCYSRATYMRLNEGLYF